MYNLQLHAVKYMYDFNSNTKLPLIPILCYLPPFQHIMYITFTKWGLFYENYAVCVALTYYKDVTSIHLTCTAKFDNCRPVAQERPLISHSVATSISWRDTGAIHRVLRSSSYMKDMEWQAHTLNWKNRYAHNGFVVNHCNVCTNNLVVEKYK